MSFIKIEKKIKNFNKDLIIAGDKSLSIRWALLASQSNYKSKSYNLLNSEVEYTQGGQPYQIYEKGTKFSVSVDWDL